MKKTAIAFIVFSMIPGFSAGLNSAESYLVLDHESGQVLAAKQEQAPRQVASLTKIATVMVTLEWMDDNGGDFSELLSVSGDAISGGANPLGVKIGDRVTLETALFAAMMASDNTSASVVAEAFGRKMNPSTSGPEAVSVFVGRMNDLAQKLGMEKTRFINPHGLDGENESGFSTAADMARLAIHAYDHPEFPGFCLEKKKIVNVFRGDQVIEVGLINTNELLGSRGIDGTKTGTTRKSGGCLIVSATGVVPEEVRVEKRRLIVVVLKSEDRFRVAVLLLNVGWAVCKSRLEDGGGGGANDHLRKGVK